MQCAPNWSYEECEMSTYNMFAPRSPASSVTSLGSVLGAEGLDDILFQGPETDHGRAIPEKDFTLRTKRWVLDDISGAQPECGTRMPQAGDSYEENAEPNTQHRRVCELGCIFMW